MTRSMGTLLARRGCLWSGFLDKLCLWSGFLFLDRLALFAEHGLQKTGCSWWQSQAMLDRGGPNEGRYWRRPMLRPINGAEV